MCNYKYDYKNNRYIYCFVLEDNIFWILNFWCVFMYNKNITAITKWGKKWGALMGNINKPLKYAIVMK